MEIMEILDAFPFYVMLVDGEHKILLANKAAKQHLGTRHRKIIGGYCPKVVHGIDGSIHGCPLKEAVEEGHAVEKELFDGPSGRWFHSAIYPIECKTEDGKRIFLHTIKDITEKKRMEEQLEEKNKELENIVYAATHDLRAPLVSIEGYVSLVARENRKKLDGNAAHYLERIGENTKQMEGLIQDLLELSRMGRIPLKFETCDAGTLIDEALRRFQPELERKGVKLVLKACCRRVHCDRTRIVQVLGHLIDNAIKFGLSVQKPVIEMGVQEKKGKAVEFWVRDNGPGIRKEYQDRIFELFQRLNKDIRGRGIGLTMVKKVAEAHRGTAGVDSEKDKGSRFYLVLPGK